MSWLLLHTFAQISVERILNALPEGFLIAFFAWALLSLLRRQNSGTRFAVWFVALLTVAALPVLGGLGAGQVGMSLGITSGSLRPAIVVPGRWALFVFMAWALGAGVAMLRLAVGFARLRCLRQSCSVIMAADLDPALRKTVAAIGRSSSVAARSITVATSESVRVPAAIGFWKRTIVLPAWTLRELPPDDLNVILLHEFAHLQRWDDWTNLIQKLVRALFFFHPAVWWIENRLSVEREMACDDAVLAETANPRGYASCLVSLLEKSAAHRLPQQLSHQLSQEGWSMAQAAVHRAREASLRLAQILDTGRPKATRVWKPALGIAGAFSIVCLFVLARAPQIVAFDGSASTSNLAATQPASKSSLSLSEEPGVPAQLHSLTALNAHGRDARRSATRPHAVAGHQITQAGAAVARLQESPTREPFVAVSARAEEHIVPQFQTLLLVETTQYVISNSSVWRIQVWRFAVVGTSRGLSPGVPIAHSI